MVSEERTRRIAQRIREELSEMLIFEVSDPRLGGVSITDVRVDRELAFANIFVSAVEGSERKDEILEGFEAAKGFLRRQLARRIQLKSFPHLRVYWDPSPEHADRIDRLIASLHADEDDQESTPGDE
jgi:ribosome-binding factor A